MRFGRSFNMTTTVSIEINTNNGPSPVTDGVGNAGDPAPAPVGRGSLMPLQINKALVLDLSSKLTPAEPTFGGPQPVKTEVAGSPTLVEITNTSDPAPPVAVIRGSGAPLQINKTLIEDIAAKIQLKSLDNAAISPGTDGFNFSNLGGIVTIAAADPDANVAEASANLTASGTGHASISVYAISYTGEDGAFASVVAAAEGDVVSGSVAAGVTAQDWIF